MRFAPKTRGTGYARRTAALAKKPLLIGALLLSGWAAYTTTITPASATAITDVTSTIANGTYGVGQVIPVIVDFSALVDVTGTPQLALNSGGTASYSSGSGTNGLDFTYVVAAGQNSPSLDYTSTGALSLNGGTINDLSNNPATLTLPTPGSAGSLSGSKSIIINTIPPTITDVTSSTANGTYGVGAVILIIIDFTAPVDVTGTPLLDLNSGGTASYSSGSGTNDLDFTYVVAVGQNSTLLDYTSTTALILNGGTISGQNGTGPATLTLPIPGSAGSLGANKDIVVDTSMVIGTVPEPGSLAIFGSGVALLALRRRQGRA